MEGSIQVTGRTAFAMLQTGASDMSFEACTLWPSIEKYSPSTFISAGSAAFSAKVAVGAAIATASNVDTVHIEDNMLKCVR